MTVLYDGTGRGISMDNPLPTRAVQSDAMLPIDIQSHYAQTIQTHNAVNIVASGSSIQSSWIDCDGFDKLGIISMNDASANNQVNLDWSVDGVTKNGQEIIFSNTADRYRAIVTDVKCRYVRVVLFNLDSTTAHTMSAWAYLKA